MPETMKPRRIEISPPAGLIGKDNPADRIKAA
jgi:hypothetical protein